MKKIFEEIIIILLIVEICMFSFFLYKLKEENKEMPDNTATLLASSITVLRPSFMTYSQIQSILKSTGLAGYEKAFLTAEEQSGIGADYLISIAAHESGWGSNYWWKEYNNCFSWGITDSGVNSEGLKIKNMSKGDAIVYIANQIKKNYLTKGGAYYSGETLAAIGKYYASDTSWANNVIAIHNQIIKNLPESTLAKQWIMSAQILKGDLSSPKYYTEDYFTRPITREELSIILYRINRR